MAPLSCFSQIEVTDSLSIGASGTGNVHIAPIEITDTVSITISHPGNYYPTAKPMYDEPIQYKSVHPYPINFLHHSFTPGQAWLPYWNHGGILITGSTALFPGMMQIDSGGLSINQTIGNLTVNAGMTANKYGYFRGLHTQYGFSGSATYRFSPKLSATVFGEYYWGRPPMMGNGMAMPPSMIGYYGRSNYGGYFDYRINDHWGVETGFQTVRQIGSNKYQGEPIVTPYYKFNNKVSIYIPVGQILYHIIRNTSRPRR